MGHHEHDHPGSAAAIGTVAGSPAGIAVLWLCVGAVAHVLEWG